MGVPVIMSIAQLRKEFKPTKDAQIFLPETELGILLILTGPSSDSKGYCPPETPNYVKPKSKTLDVQS